MHRKIHVFDESVNPIHHGSNNAVLVSLKALKLGTKEIQRDKALPDRSSSQLLPEEQRVQNNIFIVIVKSARRPVGLNIIADSFKTDLLLAGFI